MCHSVHTWIDFVTFTHKYMYLFLVLAVMTIDFDQLQERGATVVIIISLGTLVNDPVSHWLCMLTETAQTYWITIHKKGYSH